MKKYLDWYNSTCKKRKKSIGTSLHATEEAIKVTTLRSSDRLRMQDCAILLQLLTDY